MVTKQETLDHLDEFLDGHSSIDEFWRWATMWVTENTIVAEDARGLLGAIINTLSYYLLDLVSIDEFFATLKYHRTIENVQ